MDLSIIIVSAFKSAAYIQVHYRLDFFIEENNINTDKIAPPLGAVCSGSLKYSSLWENLGEC